MILMFQNRNSLYHGLWTIIFMIICLKFYCDYCIKFWFNSFFFLRFKKWQGKEHLVIFLKKKDDICLDVMAPLPSIGNLIEDNPRPTHQREEPSLKYRRIEPNEMDANSLECDIGLRPQIWQFPINKKRWDMMCSSQSWPKST